MQITILVFVCIFFKGDLQINHPYAPCFSCNEIGVSLVCVSIIGKQFYIEADFLSLLSVWQNSAIATASGVSQTTGHVIQVSS